MSGRSDRRPPFLVQAAESVFPVVITCEHATNRLPFSRGVGSEHRAVLRTHWGWDIGAWELSLELARRLGATAVGGRWSRLLIDLNRRVDDPTLVRTQAGDVLLPWNQKLRAEELERRLMTVHTPYHVEVDRVILRRLVRGIRPLVFAVHTFTDTYEGRHRPFDVGVLYEEHRGLAHRLGRRLRRAGLSVRYNQPYSGMAGMMYAVDRHGSHHRLPCLELEVNQVLFERRSAVSRLGAATEAGIREILAAKTPG